MRSSGRTSVYGYLKSPSMVDYPGRLSAVMLTSGCNFRCEFCHNAQLMGTLKPGLRWDQVSQACDSFQEDWVTACTVSGGEPTLAPDIRDILTFLKSRGFAVKLDTNGSRPDVLETLIPLVDYVAMDIKCSLPAYKELTGFDRSDAIQQSIGLLQNCGVDYEFRTTVIESFHDRQQIKDIGQAVYGAKRLVLQPFLPRADLPSQRFAEEKRTTPDILLEAAAILEDYVHKVIVRGAGKQTINHQKDGGSKESFPMRQMSIL